VKRKLQVFVSSTYEDLKEERQAAVEAILKAGHIPAGMELFTAGSESQLNVIRRWIEESDVYVLILGGRYGTIEPTSGLSYTEVEFDYARSLGKTFFSIVMNDEGLEAKVKRLGTAILEKGNEQKYREFKDRVTSHMCAFFATPQEVRLAVFETLPQMQDGLRGGWIAANDVRQSEDVTRELTAVLEESRALRARVAELERKNEKLSESSPSFGDLFTTIVSEMISVPPEVSGLEEPVERSLLDLALNSAEELARGVANTFNASKVQSFLFFRVASRLASYGLVEHGKVPTNVAWQRLKLSKDGVRFLTEARILLEKQKQLKVSQNAPPPAATTGTDVGAVSALPQDSARRRRKKRLPSLSRDPKTPKAQ
jgi:hypothetical protein